MTGRFKLERAGLAAVALGSNASELSAIANDYSYAEVFSRPLAALVRRGDVAVGLSGSGGSANVVAALRAARSAGAFCVAFTGSAKGPAGGPVGEAADLALVVPSASIAEVQEVHLALGHALCGLVEDTLAAPRQKRKGRR
jgi:D-sedoheptulose 7-phosphate isomerase